MYRVIIVVSLILSSIAASAQSVQDTLRIMTYNILKYNGTARNSYLQAVVTSIDPDVIVVQEMQSQTGVNSFAANVLNNAYATIKFNDGPDTDNHVFFRDNKITFLNADYLSTSLRDIAEYEVQINSSYESLFIYSVHLKASSGSDNEQQRLGQATILRERLDRHRPGTYFIVLGDYNIYYSNEPAYQKLIQEENNPSGQSFDPIATPGNWHNNIQYAAVHTQSSRNVQLPDGGSNGGLDDRFDFILISDPLWNNILVASYTSYGNDGAHFNKSINEGTNSAVSPEIADAIFYGSDHLPLYCDFVFDVATILEAGPDIQPDQVRLFQNYPNPFNPVTIISFYLPQSEHVQLIVYDIAGRKIQTLINQPLPAGHHVHKFLTGQLAGGIYFYRLQTGSSLQTRKLVILK